MINEQLAIFEKLARQLVEGAFDKPLGQRKVVREIARQIAIDVEKCAANSNEANSYSIQLHPDDLRDLLAAGPDLQDYLNEYMLELVSEFKLASPGQTGVRFVANREMDRKQVLVQPEPNPSLRELTVRDSRFDGENALSALSKLDAFLILDGKRHVKLRQPLLTIGRHLDSDIVIDDSTVSRQHAQLRWRYDRFIILDLGSKVGTLVNNRSISQQILQNGDVIRLGLTSIIYGEELSADEIRPSPPKAVDGSTRQLPRRNL